MEIKSLRMRQMLVLYHHCSQAGLEIQLLELGGVELGYVKLPRSRRDDLNWAGRDGLRC